MFHDTDSKSLPAYEPQRHPTNADNYNNETSSSNNDPEHFGPNDVLPLKLPDPTIHQEFTLFNANLPYGTNSEPLLTLEIQDAINADSSYQRASINNGKRSSNSELAYSSQIPQSTVRDNAIHNKRRPKALPDPRCEASCGGNFKYASLIPTGFLMLKRNMQWPTPMFGPRTQFTHILSR